jgi:hypothetical protein
MKLPPLRPVLGKYSVKGGFYGVIYFLGITTYFYHEKHEIFVLSWL